MTVVDSSAVVAVLLAESESPTFLRAFEESDPLYMSTGTMLETGTVLLHRKGIRAVAEFFRLLDVANIEIVPVSEQHARGAIDAYGRFGKSTRHPARLNFGDCFSYALARAMDLPLLYKGDDFSKTDIRSAL